VGVSERFGAVADGLRRSFYLGRMPPGWLSSMGTDGLPPATRASDLVKVRVSMNEPKEPP
jgi:hypothetical protein